MDTPSTAEDTGLGLDTAQAGPEPTAAGAAHEGREPHQAPETAAGSDPSDTAEEPVTIAPDAEPEEGPGFADLGLAPAVAQAVSDLGYETPTAVQRQCIPHLLEGRDLLGQAQTGTGKTAAFALPLLSRIDPAAKEPQVLVLTPTRELALQVAEAFQRYAHNLKGFHVLPIYGGQSYGLQVRQLQRVPQVVVGTPGRIMDHMRRSTLSLDGLKSLVLDEADEMLNMGFAEDIDWIFEHTPADRQVALFSATMPPEILRVARDHLIDPVEIRIQSATATVDTIDQQHCVVTRFHKADVLTRILELETFDGMLVFVRTKGGTAELADKLRSQGFAAEPLNGDMSQEARERTVDRLKRGQLDILVATDVAARGLDVERVSHVVNFDIPTDPSAYVHRIGRTGRAGRTGKAILLVEPRERGLLRAIERTIRRPIPEMAPPSAAQLSATRVERFIEQIRGTLAEQDLDFFYRLMARISKEQELDPMDMAAALGYLIQRERPLEVKETPRPEHRRDFREERPRRQDRDRGGERGEPRFRRDHGGNSAWGSPPGEGRGRQEGERGRFGRSPEGGGDREARFERPRDGNRDDRTYGRERHPRSDDRPSRGERETRWEDRAPRNERPRFEREPNGNRDDRGFRPQREHWQDRPRETGRSDWEQRREEHRGEGFRREQGPGQGGREGGYERRDGRRPRGAGPGGVDLVTHRIEVGRRDGVTPREIVGAIANESGLDGRYIGHIDIREDHSTVDLPGGMPREVFSHLKRVFVRGQALRISVLGGHRGPRDEDPRGERPPRDGASPQRPRRFAPDEGGERGPGPERGFRRKHRD